MSFEQTKTGSQCRDEPLSVREIAVSVPIKKLVIDLDGTLCTQMPGDLYHLALPFHDMISRVNVLYDAGWHVTIFTARGMNRFKGDVSQVESSLGDMTRDWLLKNGVRYSRLMFGKPPADLYVDDKGMSPHEFLWNF